MIYLVCVCILGFWGLVGLEWDAGFGINIFRQIRTG